jgi:hypothetical protein
VNQQEKEKQSLSNIMKATDLLSAYRTNPDPLHMPSIADNMKIGINREFLNQFLNELTFQKIITTQDIKAYRVLEANAEMLISLIKKEYHLK